MYIIRLDDASEYCDKKKWNKIEKILDKYSIKPIVGIIPNNKDKTMTGSYKKDIGFWNKAKKWQEKKWLIAMHGFNHVYTTCDGGINPVQKRSEFAGVDFATQSKMIKEGIKVFEKHNIFPNIFFAPSHTFDINTLKALKDNSNITVVSDTISNDIYYKDSFFFLPVQSGKVRNLPFKFVTFCYHPNEMNDEDFIELENFIIKNRNKFNDLDILNLKKRKKSLYDSFLSFLYFLRRG